MSEENTKLICKYYSKVGICIDENCMRYHSKKIFSRVVVFKRIFPDPILFIESLPENIINFDESDLQKYVDSVFYDIYIMCKRFGPVDDILIVRNNIDQLQGSAFVLFREIDAAYACYLTLNGCYYAGRQIEVYLSATNRFSDAVCKNTYKDCVNSDFCHYLHPYVISSDIYNSCFPKSEKTSGVHVKNTKVILPDSIIGK